MKSRENDDSELPTKGKTTLRPFVLDFGAYFVLPLFVIIGLYFYPDAPLALLCLLMAVPAARALYFGVTLLIAKKDS